MTNTHCRDGRSDVLHGVVNGETGGDGAAGGVDVEVYRGGGLVTLKEEELSDDRGGDAVVYGAVEADYALGEEAREDVVFPRQLVSVENEFQV